MAEYIKRADALKAATLAELDVDFVIEAIRNIPTADVVEVVRCKDCKSCNTDIAVDGWYGTCAFWNGHSVMADDYCSRFRHKDSADMRETEPQKCDTCSHGAHWDGVVICDKDGQRHSRTDGCKEG